MSNETVREDEGGVVRGRPGRRSVEERTEAVLSVLSGKASVDQVALQYGVHADTVEKWKEEALKAVAESFRRGPSPHERELAKQIDVLTGALTRQTMKAELLERALEMRGVPSLPTRSRR
jgi:transposase-like protein